jgi:hypothetical protein
MATTVLSGTSGALYYKPAGTTASFAPADVTTATAVLSVGSYFNFKVGDPVKFRVVNQAGGTPTGTLPSGITAGTVYYVIGYTASTGALTVSATLGGSVITITTQGTAVSPNKFEAYYSDYVVVGQTRDWKFDISRAEIDVTTIGQTPGQYVPFKNYIAGFGDGNGSCTVYMSDDDFAIANRIIEDVLQRQQGGAAFKLYTNRIISSGTTIDDTKSRSIALDAILTSASISVDPDNAQTISINFRPASTPTFDFSTTA